jgi:hypothetical protein
MREDAFRPPRAVLWISVLASALAPVAAGADEASGLSEPYQQQPANYTFSFDAQLRPRMGAEALTSAFRVALRGKDLLLDRLAGPDRVPPIPWGVGQRLVELVLVDTPLAISTQTFAHEIFGHGGRVREFGGTATYVWKPPFPYSTQTSYYEPNFTRPLSDDEQVLIFQGGLALEGFQRHEALRSAFVAGTWSHGDAMNYFAWALHLAGYGAMRDGDVANWTSVMAARYELQQPDVQRSYLLSAAAMELLDPLFVYSVYTIFYRFLVLGERSARVPSISVMGVPLWLSTHLDPVPWGVEYQVDVFARTGLGIWMLGPRFGAGPGGKSAGVALGLYGVRLHDQLRLDAELGLWLQPEVSVLSEGVVLGPPPTAPPGLPSPAPAHHAGVGGQLEVTYQLDHWLAGFRIGAKTAGLNGIDPVAPALESVVVLGLRLD